MSETQYIVEHAKSGRSKCKKCKAPIPKGEIRIKTESHNEESGMHFSSSFHVQCFTVPKKLRVSPEEFVNDVLEDESGTILPEKAEEIIAQISAKEAKKSSTGGDDDDGNPMSEIKAEFNRREEEGNDGEEKASKKAKSNMTAMVEAYKIYKGYKNSDLNDTLSWNRQIKTGTKDVMMMKCIDGHVFGRLALCPLCTGKLKMDLSMTKIICNGRYDESSQMRIPCSNEYDDVSSAPRLLPWYSEEPTEEQAAEMDGIIEEAQGNGTASGSHDDDIGALKKQAATLEWKLTGKAGLKKALGDLLKVLQAHPNKLDLPDDEKDARTKLGQIIQMHRDKTAEEIIPFVVQELGFKDDKAAVEEKKEKKVEEMCKNPKNKHIVAAFLELSELYFKEGNRNAGASYTNAVNGLKGVEFEITTENAATLDKAKTKVPGVGKSTREKIEELLKTGHIAKLDEKRAANGM